MNDRDSPKREPLPWMRWMPNWMEFGIVFTLTLWPFVYASLSALFVPPLEAPITQDHLRTLIVSETFVLAIVAPLMYARGWTVAALGFRFNWRDILIACVLLVLTYAGYFFLWILFSTFMPNGVAAGAQTSLIGSEIQAGTAIAASVVNGFFEELFVAGYLIQSLRSRFGVIVAINVSILVRLSYHLYQGPIGVISIVPCGLVFAWAFARTGKLLPLILAHMFADMISLL